MTSAGDTILGFGERFSRWSGRVGRYVGNDGPSALVDIGGQRVTMPFFGGTVPQINESVHVWSFDGAMFMAGPTTAKPGMGVVATVSGDYVTVMTDFGDFVMPYAAPDIDAPAPTSGDSVGIDWSSGPKCYRLSTSPDPVPPPPDPGGVGAEVKTAEFRAIDAGSTDRGAPRYWQPEVWASNTTYGFWFYGNQIKDTVPADAEFVSLEVYVSWRQRSGGAPRWVLHDAGAKVGIPGVSPYTEWAPGAGWQPLPDQLGWFNALKAGGPYAGIGLNQGGWNKFSSLAQDGLSGALRIKWR